MVFLNRALKELVSANMQDVYGTFMAAGTTKSVEQPFFLNLRSLLRLEGRFNLSGLLYL